MAGHTDDRAALAALANAFLREPTSILLPDRGSGDGDLAERSSAAFVFAGTGSTIIDKCSVCDDVTLGAGAVVVDAITESGVYVGAPARRIPDKGIFGRR